MQNLYSINLVQRTHMHKIIPPKPSFELIFNLIFYLYLITIHVSCFLEKNGSIQHDFVCILFPLLNTDLQKVSREVNSMTLVKLIGRS